MAVHKRLGIHWGEKGFVFVEVAREMPVLTAFVPFSSADDAPVVGLKSLSDDIKLLDVLQKTVRNKGISTVEVYLSLPSKDILIRWFLIPWVKTSEIQDVVGFEIKKYIPFSIEEISYTYYPKTVLKDGLRQIGILFVGIRKNSFEKYINVLTQAGLNVVYSEPSAMSLVRALVSKRLIDLNQVTAILQTSDEAGELIITSGGQVKFIRDFRTNLGEGQGAGDVQDALRARIFGEVRISLEFFSRQYAEEEVSRIVIISSEKKQSLWAGLSDDLGITVNVVDPLREIGGGEGMDMGGVNAFGATMAGNVSAVIDFNLSENASQPVALKQEEVSHRNRQLILPILVGVACAALIGAVFFIGGIFVEGMRKQLAEASVHITGYEEMPLDEIQSKASVEQKKMDAVGSLPLKARAVPLIILLTKIVSRDGVWLSSISVTFVDGEALGKASGAAGGKAASKVAVYTKVSTRVSLAVTGYVYKNDSNKEFDLANEIVNDLRKDKTFTDFFSSIKLAGLRSEQLMTEKKATVFSISCEGK